MRTLCLAWVLGCSIYLVGQAAPSSVSPQRLTGVSATVRGATGDAIPGAELLLNAVGLPSENDALRRDGSFGAGFNIPPGDYVLTAKFNPHIKKSVPIKLAQREAPHVLFVLLTDNTPACGPISVKEMPDIFGKDEDETKAATVSLTVYDPSGALIPSASAELLRVASATNRAPVRLTADALGSATVALEPGAYSLNVRMRGFRELRFRFTVSGGQIWGLAAVLPVASTCDGVKVEAPERSTTPPSPNDRIDPRRP